MSFTDRFTSLMARPNEDLVNREDVSPFMKYAARILGAVGGGIAIFLGVWAAIGLITGSVSCFIAGIFQMLAGFLVIVVEAPCCCVFLDFVGQVSNKVDARPYWNRAVLYVGLAIPPILLCFSLSTIVGSGLIFGTGALYGLMALGKKATVEEMQNNAAGAQAPSSQPSFINSGMKASLVENTQPVAKTDVIRSNV